MTREELDQWCRENQISANERMMGKQAVSALDAQRTADATAGKVLRALADAGVDDKLKMSKAEAVAKMQKGIASFAERERQRMAVANYQLNAAKGASFSRLDTNIAPKVELPDRVGLDSGPLIVVK